ncbi:(2Fe-2S)-binding protein [Streptomyces spiralis]
MSATRHPSRVAEAPVLPERGPGPVKVTLTVNGTEHAVEIEQRVGLLDALRERPHPTGAKKRCDQGTCGARTVWIGRRRTLSCLTRAINCEGREVTAVEGPAEDGEPHTMQRAFIEHGAFRCGYCTSGQIKSAVTTSWP